MAAKTFRSSTARRQAPALVANVGELFHNLARTLFDTYRPELHYMRGPGPKWHAKHDRTDREPVTFDALPALARVRVKG